MNIYYKTSSPPTIPSDFQSTSDAKGNDFCLVVVIFNSQKSTKYIIRVMFSWPVWARAFLSSVGIGSTRSQVSRTKTPTLHIAFNIMEII